MALLGRSAAGPHLDAFLPAAVRTPGTATLVRIGDVVIGGPRVPVLAGPCAAEPGYLDHAIAVAETGAAVLRGCVLKPRTRPQSFQGLGHEGAPLLDEARRRTGLPIIAEPLTVEDIDWLMPHTDAFLIGARSMQNTPLLRAAGQSGRPVVLKRAFSATYDEWLGAAEYILAEGNDQVVLCERGIRSFETTTRNTLDISAIVALRERTPLPIIVDPSHASGRGAWVSALSLAAVAGGADGLLVECHPHPAESWCDPLQAITPEQLRPLIEAVNFMAAVVRPLPATGPDAAGSAAAAAAAAQGLAAWASQLQAVATETVAGEAGTRIGSRG
ncbi:MAG TPA: 3-deoxy-7-phosphoheptulonate synthase [Candidatus Dormibacteraeota bacterium]